MITYLFAPVFVVVFGDRPVHFGSIKNVYIGVVCLVVHERHFGKRI